MTVKVLGESEIWYDVSQVLLQHLSPTRAVRFWASWQVGHSDYLRWRDEQFGDETVVTLYEKVLAHQESQPMLTGVTENALR